VRPSGEWGETHGSYSQAEVAARHQLLEVVASSATAWPPEHTKYPASHDEDDGDDPVSVKAPRARGNTADLYWNAARPGTTRTLWGRDSRCAGSCRPMSDVTDKRPTMAIRRRVASSPRGARPGTIHSLERWRPMDSATKHEIWVIAVSTGVLEAPAVAIIALAFLAH
jgi:hypothetical protein